MAPPMHVISRRRLREFWADHPDAEQPLKAWFAEAAAATWRQPPDVKEKYGSASILPEGRVVFNVGGNKYRLVARINYESGTVFIRFVGTHKDYDKIDARSI